MAIYALKFMFDWGSGTCVWSTNAAARKKYGYPVDLRLLPISAGLRQRLLDLCSKHDEALDWNCPSEPLLWSREQRMLFCREAQSGYVRLCRELDAEYEISFEEDMLL